MILSNFADILQCPITRADLRWLDADQIAQLNAKSASGGFFHLGGMPVQKPLSQAFASAEL